MQPTPGTPPDPPDTPPRRGLPRLLRLLLGAVAAVVGLVVAILLALQSPVVGTRVVLEVLGRIELPNRATMTVREVRGDWIRSLEFQGFRLARGETLLVAIDTLRVRHDPRALLRGHVDIAAFDLRGVTVTGDVIDTTSRAPAEPRLSIGDLLHGRFYAGQPIRLRLLTLERGRFVHGVSDSLPGFEDVALTLRDGALGDGRLALRLDRLTLRSTGASPFTLAAAGSVRDGRAELTGVNLRGGATRLSGGAAIATGAARGAGIERMELNAEAWPLALADLRTFVPQLDATGEVTAHLALSGSRVDSLGGNITASLDEVRVGTHRIGATRLVARFDGGRADLTHLTAYENANVAVTGWVRPLDTQPTYDLGVTADHLPRRIAGVPAWEAFVRRADFATTARVRGEGFVPARFDIDATVRGAAGRARLAGNVDTRDSVRWEVRRLTFDDVDVARLAGQPGPSALSGSATARGHGAAGTAELALRDAQYGDWQLAAAEAKLKLDAGARYRVSDGRFSHLTLEDSDLSGRFRAEGRGADARAWLELDPSTLRGQHVESGQLTATLARGNLVLEGDADSPSGRVRIAAQARPLDKVPSYDVEEVRFENVDVRAWTRGQAPKTSLTGTLRMSGRGTAAATGALQLERSTVDGFAIDAADGRFDLAEGRVQADLEVQTAGGTARLHAEGDTTAYHADGSIPFGVLAHLLGRDSLETEGALRFTAEGQGTNPRTARVAARAFGQGRIDRARVDSLEVQLHIDHRIATLDTLVLISNTMTANGSGRVVLTDSSGLNESDLHLAIAARDLDPLEPLLGLDSLGVASATFDARLHGPAHRLVFEATGAVRSLAVNGLRLVSGDYTAGGALDPQRRVETAQARLGLRTLHNGPMKVHDAQALARWDDGKLAFETTVELDALHRAVLAGAATFDSAATRVTLDRADVHADSITWRLDRPARFAIGAERYAVEDFEAHSQRGVVKARGVVDRRGEQNLDVELRGVGLDFISAWMGRTDLGGRIDGTLELRGSAAEPRARGELQAALTAEGRPAGTLSSKVDWDGRRLELDGAFAPPTGSPLTLTGHLPLVVSLAADPATAAGAPTAAAAPARVFAGDIDLRVRGDKIALAAFAPLLDPKAVGTPEGTLDVNLRLAGPSEDVAGSGYLIVKDGAVALPALGVAYTDAQLRIELEEDRVLLREARVTSNDGTLRAEGALTIASLTRVEPDLRIKAKEFEAISTKDMHVVVSGDLTVTGRLLAPVVRGTASVEDTDVYLTKAMMEGANAAPEVALTPADIRMLEETFGPVTAKGPDLTMRLYDASDLDLQVELERNTWVRQRMAPRLALELTGKFRLKKPPGAEPDLTGRIAPVPGHGYVEQFARKFDFTGGEVLLNGPMTSHTVNIQTTYKRASTGDSGGDDVIVKLDVTGQIDKLALTLSSEPAMSPTEIVSYIATGQTKAEMATDPSSSSTTASIAAQTALAQVTGQVEDIAKEAVGLDVVQIRQDAVQGATLVAGRYLSPKIYVGFRQPVQYQGNDATSTSTNYRTQVEVEYEAFQWLLMNLQGEASEINSFIRVRRAY